MPRYLIITHGSTPEKLLSAVGVLTSRFPEVSLDSLTTEVDGSARVLCSAPSEEHTRRWLASADIDLESIALYAYVDHRATSGEEAVDVP